jgi:hypothetical protein
MSDTRLIAALLTLARNAAKPRTAPPQAAKQEWQQVVPEYPQILPASGLRSARSDRGTLCAAVRLLGRCL